jgi:predicted nucleic-acid-binding protein
MTAARPGFISLVTLAEVVWTLTTRYDLSAAEIARVLEGLLAAPNLVVQNEGEVAAAMRSLQTGGTFPDALIRALGLWAGCSSTLTFDRKAARLPGFEFIA